MANQIHRQLEQGELHRPERTGTGSPVGQSFTFLEDGQYYQDTDTGSVWRYREFTNSWEELLQYDRGTGKITNVTTGVAVQATNLGKTTSALGTGTITGVIARLVVQIQAGTDIKIISTASDDITISLTVLEDVGPGDVTIDVQPTTSNFTFPAGSSIVLESGLQGAYDSVDPTKIERKIERTQEKTTIGTIAGVVGSFQSAVTQISLQLIPDVIELRDGQVLVIMNQRGESQKIIVDGAQTLQAGNGTLTIQTFDPIYNYVRGRAFVYEPSYKSTTRITQTENSIELQAQQISGLDTFTSTLNVAVNQNSAQISLLTQAQAGQNVTIAGLEANATSQQATLALLAQAQDGQNTAIAGLELNASTQQATLALLTQAQSGQNVAIAGLEANATAQQATLALLAQAQSGQNSAISSLELNATAQQATLSLLSQANEGQNAAIAAINATANSQAATLTLVSQVVDTHNVDIVSLNDNITRVDGNIDTLNTQVTQQTLAIAGINITATAQQAQINTSVQYNDVGAYIDLLAGPNGSSITLQADQINVDGVVTFINDNATTTIDGDRITTGTITASQINVGDLFSETIEVGNVIKSNNYVVDTTGFAIFSNGYAEFQNVVVSGKLISGAGSSLDGNYVSNINAGTITVGTLSADRIASNSISATKITSGTITALQIQAGSINTDSLQANAVTAAKINVADLYATNATVNGVLTIDGGKLITKDSGNYVEITSAGIRGVDNVLGETFKLPTDGSAPVFASGQILSSAFFIGVNSVLKTSNDALAGDAGVLINNTGIFAGSAGQNTSNANFRVLASDGSLVAQSANIAGKLVAQSGSFVDGIYVSNINAGSITVGTIQASQINVADLFSESIEVGNVVKSNNYVADTTGFAIFSNGHAEFQNVIVAGKLISGAGSSLDGSYVSNINAGTIIVGTLDGNVVNIINLNASYITAGSIDANVITVSNLNASSITSGSIDANVITVSNLNASLITAGSIDANVITVSNINASLITAGGIDANVITVSNLNASLITAGSIDANTITVSNLNASLITAGGIDANVINVSNLNASAITAGTLNVAGLVSANAIEASKINVNDLFAQNITIQSGGSISGSNFTFNDTGGNIAGWIIGTDTLKSAESGARIELNKGKNRVSVFDAIGEKAAMGYLEGLPKNDASGNWSSTDYGFWAKNGDRLVIDGDIEYDSGDWLIQNDASYKVLDGSSTPKEIIRLGTDAGEKGLFLYDTNVTSTSNTDSNITYTTGDVVAKFVSTGFYIGDNASANYIEYDQSSGTLTLRGTLNASDLIAGSIDANVITVSNLNASLITSGSIDANVITVSNLNASLITAGSIDANVITVSNINASLISVGGIDANVITVSNINASQIVTGGIDANVINVSNINASLITVGTIDAGRINVDALFAESATISNVISVGSSTSPMQIGVNLKYAENDGGFETGDGIKIDANNYWFFSTSEDVPVFRIGDSSNYVSWTGSTLDVRGTLNASDIVSGTIDVARLNVSDIFSENATINATLNIGTSGEFTFGTGVIDKDGINLEIRDFAGLSTTGLKWTGSGSANAYVYVSEQFGAPVGSTAYMDIESTTRIGLSSGNAHFSVYSGQSLYPSSVYVGADRFTVAANATFSSNVSVVKDLTVSGNVQAGNFVSSSNNAGISTSFTIESANGVYHTLTFESGILTSHTTA